MAGDPPRVAGVAQAVAARRLTGIAALVDLAGNARPAAPPPVQSDERGRVWLDRLLPAAAGVLLLEPPIWAWWTGRLRRPASIAAALVSAAGLAWTAGALVGGVPRLLVLALAAVALCLATTLAMGRASAVLAAAGGLLAAGALVLVDETRPARVALGSLPGADPAAVARSVGWRWAAVAALGAGLVLSALAGDNVRRRLSRRAPAASTFVMVGVDTAWEASLGSGSAPATLADVLDEQGLPPGVEVVGRRRDEARHEDQVLLALGGSDNQRVRAIVRQLEAAVRRRLGHRPRSQVVVLEEPGKSGSRRDARPVDVVAQFEEPDEVPRPGRDQE